jgi:hypothetical protein
MAGLTVLLFVILVLENDLTLRQKFSRQTIQAHARGLELLG